MESMAESRSCKTDWNAPNKTVSHRRPRWLSLQQRSFVVTSPETLTTGGITLTFRSWRQEFSHLTATDPGLWHVWPKGFGLT